MPEQLPDPPRTAPPSRPGWDARFTAMTRSRGAIGCEPWCGDSRSESRHAMWKRELKSRERREALSWRRILAEGGLLLAMMLTSSWLIRG